MCSVVASVLLQCRQTDFYSVYSWNIATTVFYNLSYTLLLFVVVYTLNMMLRQQLGHVSKILKIALLVIVVFMGAITCVRIGLRSYYNWTFMQGLNSSWSSRAARVQFMLAVQRFSMAWDALYLLSVLAAGALALMTIVQLRSRRSPAGVSCTEIFFRESTNNGIGPHRLGNRFVPCHVILDHINHRFRGLRPWICRLFY